MAKNKSKILWGVMFEDDIINLFPSEKEARDAAEVGDHLVNVTILNKWAVSVQKFYLLQTEEGKNAN